MTAPTETAPYTFSNLDQELRAAPTVEMAAYLIGLRACDVMTSAAARLQPTEDGATALGRRVNGLHDSISHLPGAADRLDPVAVAEIFYFGAERALAVAGRQLTPDWAMDFVGHAVGPQHGEKVLIAQAMARTWSRSPIGDRRQPLVSVASTVATQAGL